MRVTMTSETSEYRTEALRRRASLDSGGCEPLPGKLTRTTAKGGWQAEPQEWLMSGWHRRRGWSERSNRTSGPVAGPAIAPPRSEATRPLENLQGLPGFGPTRESPLTQTPPWPRAKLLILKEERLGP